MKCSDIIKQLQKLAPEELACSFDNVGLLLGRAEKSVSRVLIALEMSDEVVDLAVDRQADLIITHHPLLFHPLKRINSDDFIGRWVLKLLRNDITYYAMHTNFDRAVNGMGTLAADRLGLIQQRMLADTVEYQDAEGVTRTGGIGKIGSLPEAMTLDELCGKLSQSFELEGLRVFAPKGRRNQKLTEVAIVPGSGGEYVAAAAENGADVLITADVSHHTGCDAVSQGMVVIDAGHYCLEYPFVEYIEQYLSETVSAGVDLITAEYCPPYYHYSTGGADDRDYMA